MFGSSGNVAHYKDKVVQHPAQAAAGSRKKALRQAKKLETGAARGRAPPDASHGRHPGRHRRADGRLRRAASTRSVPAPSARSSARAWPVTRRASTVPAGRSTTGTSPPRATRSRSRWPRRSWSTPRAAASRRSAWRGGPSRSPATSGTGSARWRSAHYSEANIRLQPVTKATKKPHLVALGSIGRFIRPELDRRRHRHLPRRPRAGARRPATSRCAGRSPRASCASPVGRRSTRSVTPGCCCRASSRSSAARPTGASPWSATTRTARPRSTCPTTSTSCPC